MKETIKRDDRHDRIVFSNVNNIYPKYSKYPLGEDFYSIQTENTKNERRNDVINNRYKI